MELGSGILGGEPPVDGGSGGVALRDQSIDFPSEGHFAGEPLLQAGAGQDTELDFGHVQPTAVLGRVVKLQPPGNPPGLRRRESFVQGRRTMSVKVVHDHPHHRGLRVRFVHQPTHLMGEVLHGTPLGHRHLPPARQWLTGQEQVAGTLSPVLVVLPQRKSRPGRHRGPGLGQQLGGGLVKADYRPLGVIRFGVQVQDILHMGYEVGAYLGNAPLLLLPRLKDVFFRCSRTVRGTGTAPAPVPPPSQPATVESNGHAPPAPECRPTR